MCPAILQVLILPSIRSSLRFIGQIRLRIGSQEQATVSVILMSGTLTIETS